MKTPVRQFFFTVVGIIELKVRTISVMTPVAMLAESMVAGSCMALTIHLMIRLGPLTLGIIRHSSK